MGLVDSANTTKIDQSSYPFNKDKTSSSSSQSISKSNLNINAPNSATVNRPTQQTSKEDVLANLMRQMINVLSSGNGLLGEIADNTADKMSDFGIIN